MIPLPSAAPVSRSSSRCAGIGLALILCCVGSGGAYAQGTASCSASDDSRSAYACEKEVALELERIYRAILNGIRPGFPALLRDDQLPKQKSLFVEAQRAWELYRDRSCEADAFENYDYSGYGSAVAECRIALTRARIEQLRTGPWGVLLDGPGEVSSAEVRPAPAGMPPRQ